MNSEGNSETSYWINFFINAGIPASDSAHYALQFVDNRIDRTMLMDLNKEYLNDIGITRLGDVIAILKIAKDVHKKTLEEKVLLMRGPSAKSVSQTATVAASSGTQTNPVLIKRESPLSRAVGHCLASSRSASPIVSTSLTLSSRLGPEKATAPGLNVRRNVLVPDTVPTPAPLATPTAPRESGMNKKTVFDRLGDTKTTEANQAITTATANAKVQASSESVFTRLGGKKRATVMPSPDDDSSDSDGTPLPYAGVLISPPKKRKPSPAGPSTPPQPIHKATPVSTAAHLYSSDGILGDGAGIPKRLKDRLGKVVSPADTTQSNMAAARPTSGMAQRVNLKITTKNTVTNKPATRTGGKSRLDIGQSEVSSSSDQKQPEKASILSRLGKQH